MIPRKRRKQRQNRLLHLPLFPLKYVGQLPDGFFKWEGFDAAILWPNQEQGPGESQGDREDQACNPHTRTDYIATAVVVAVVPFVKLQNSVNFELQQIIIR